jgi:hypothetical protein
MREGRENMKPRYSATLNHHPNRDITGGYWSVPVDTAPLHVFAGRLADVVAECSDYIAVNGLGGGNWPITVVYRDGEPFCTVSYNTRVWDIQTDAEIDPDFVD